MTCEFVVLPGGGRAIVCGSHRYDRCVVCGARATQLCDWKMPDSPTGTCDLAVCTQHRYSPAPEKDLCPEHAAAWSKRQGERALRGSSPAATDSDKPHPNRGAYVGGSATVDALPDRRRNAKGAE